MNTTKLQVHGLDPKQQYNRGLYFAWGKAPLCSTNFHRIPLISAKLICVQLTRPHPRNMKHSYWDLRQSSVTQKYILSGTHSTFLNHTHICFHPFVDNGTLLNYVISVSIKRRRTGYPSAETRNAVPATTNGASKMPMPPHTAQPSPFLKGCLRNQHFRVNALVGALDLVCITWVATVSRVKWTFQTALSRM